MSGQRRSYSAIFKLTVCDYAERESNRDASRMFGIDEKNVRNWRKMKHVLQNMNSRQMARRKGQCKWPDLERQLKDWVTQQRLRKERVTTVHIKLKAKLLAGEQGIVDFTGSSGWLQKFLKRSGLSMRVRTTAVQPLPNDWEEKVAGFLAYVEMKKAKVKRENFINMDEVPCCFDLPVSGTVDLRSSDDVAIETNEAEKCRFTVLCAVSAAGEKLKPMVIFKQKTPLKVDFPSGLVARANQKGWVNGKIMEEWMNEIWKKKKSWFFNKPKPDECLLVYDACRAHLTDDVKMAALKYTQLAVIPGGLTKKLQPLDLTVRKSFKDILREFWDARMSNEKNIGLAGGGEHKLAYYETVCKLVMKAWNEIPDIVIKNGFKKGMLETYTEDELPGDEVETDDSHSRSQSSMRCESKDSDAISDTATTEPPVISEDEDEEYNSEFDGWESSCSDEM